MPQQPDVDERVRALPHGPDREGREQHDPRAEGNEHVDAAEAAVWLRGEKGVLAADALPGEPPALRLDFGGDDAALSDLLMRMIGRGLPVVAFSEETGDLEDVFMQVTGGGQ